MRMGRRCGNKCGQNVLYTYMKLSKNILNKYCENQVQLYKLKKNKERKISRRFKILYHISFYHKSPKVVDLIKRILRHHACLLPSVFDDPRFE